MSKMQGELIARSIVAAVFAVGLHTKAHASLPVPYAVVGCIVGGVFQSRGFAKRNILHSAIQAIEGKTIRVEGLLFPSDRFQATAVFIIDEQCREDLHKNYFLCEPCRTLRGMPHKQLPKQPGTDARLPPQVIRAFDDLAPL
jgi:hypothetical protein